MSDIPVNPSTVSAGDDGREELAFPINASDDDVLAALAAAAQNQQNGVGEGEPGGEDEAGDTEGINDQSAPDFGQGDAAAHLAALSSSQHEGESPGTGNSVEGGDGEGTTRGGGARVGKMWACSVCGRQFSRRFNCTTHERTHLDLRERAQYACQLCPRAFTRRHDLERHINSVHPGHVLDKAPESPDASPNLEFVMGEAALAGTKRRASVEATRIGPQQVKIRRLSNGELIQPTEEAAAKFQEHQQQALQLLEEKRRRERQAALEAAAVSAQLETDLSINIDSSLGSGHDLFGAAGASLSETTQTAGGALTAPSFAHGRDAHVERVENIAESNPDGEPVFRYGKKWACGTCGRMFVRRNNCKAHEATHRDIREHICDTCSRAFSRRHDLERHISAVHPGTPFPPRPDGTIIEPGEAIQSVAKTRRATGGSRRSGGRRHGDEYEIEESDHDDGGYRPNENEDEDEDHNLEGDEEVLRTSPRHSSSRSHLARSSRRAANPDGGAAGGAFDEYPESNLRGSRESNVRGSAEPGADLPVPQSATSGGSVSAAATAAAAQELHNKSIAALQATGAFDSGQTQALAALIARGSGASSASPVDGVAAHSAVGASNSNIDPSLQALSGPGGAFSSSDLSLGKEAGKEVTSSSAAAAAIAELAKAGFDFSGIPGLQFTSQQG